jgi:hypothetical protein
MACARIAGKISSTDERWLSLAGKLWRIDLQRAALEADCGSD